MALLDEYQVGVDGPWGDREAAHLHRRAGFGATPAEREVAVGAGTQADLRAAVDALVDIAAEDPLLDAPASGTTTGYGGPIADLPDDDSDLGKLKNPLGLNNLIAHWLYRMRYSVQPLQEQLTQFLHDHFVSEWAKIRPNISPDTVNATTGCGGSLPADPDRADRITSDMMLNQNYLLRRQGIDDFRILLQAVTRDPGMLIYLDNVSNVKGRAQENYAREMMELFSMGVGNYSENDIREIAKCLTGETLPNFTCENDWDFLWSFDPAIHEPGAKQVFGVTVPENFNGNETVRVIDLVMQKVCVSPPVQGLAAPYNTLPATAVYMAWKLLRWFVGHDIVLNPPDPAVLEFAHYLRGSDNAAYPQRRYPYDFRAALRKLFLSKYFYDNAHFYNMYKTPADYVTMALRMLDSADLFTNEFGPGVQMVLMGQILFNPPNVSGWQNGKTWITSSSLVQRYNYGFWVTEVVMRGDAADERIDNLLAANGGPITTAESFDELIDYYRERLIQAEITAEERAVLTSMMQGIGGFDPGRFRSRVRALIHAMMAMPIVQLK